MRRNFSLPAQFKLKDPRVSVRIVLGALLVANLVAALIVFRPFGGSAEDLARQQQQLRQQLTAAQAKLEKSKVVVAKVEQARKEGEQFLIKYITDRRSTMSTVEEELVRMATEAGVTAKGDTKNLTPIEGSDSLLQMTMSEVYEGEYDKIARLVNLIDRSQRFLIISSMVAAPKSNSKLLTVTLRLDTFVRGSAEDES